MTRYYEINQQSHNIRCKVYCRDLNSIRKAVIFCHGFGGHKDNGAAEKLAERITAKYKGTALICFNLPCHGDDVKKKLRLSDCTEYLDLVVEDTRQRFSTEELYCCATSFGGYLTLLYLLDRGNPFRKIVLRCPAVNIYEALTGTIMTPENREQLQKGRDAAVGFDRKVPVSTAFLQELQENDVRHRDYLDWAEDILILHGTADEIIPYREALAFSEECLIELIPIEGADHRFRDSAKMEQAMKLILTFYGW